MLKDVEASKVTFLELQSKGYVRHEDLPLEAKDGRHIEVEFVSNVYLVNHKKVIQCNIRDIYRTETPREAYKKLATNWNSGWRIGRSNFGRLFLRSKL